ncbi:starvation-inducible DNA-binding protein [Balneicella halophila]|uniref:Starvation-inducible DNA-binding protein n=1 Tax=Balneicella halophila TaxID=1537566 RepID=A0A7L4UT55_BALHA|nr:Dps family protein [Balneicella halophila]PVX52487.1 starvation-inducible DNA-binding protein [Balneicella halophila]
MSTIGLSKETSVKVADSLNELLADYHIFYMNVRGFHWNIKGHKFFVLHEKFEELYDDLFEKIDEVAERVLTLGQSPKHAYSNYLKVSKVKEATDISDAEGTVSSILDSFEVIIEKQREILDLTDELEDEGTNALMSDYISEQEKLVWMYSSFLGK